MTSNRRGVHHVVKGMQSTLAQAIVEHFFSFHANETLLFFVWERGTVGLDAQVKQKRNELAVSRSLSPLTRRKLYRLKRSPKYIRKQAAER